MNSLGIYFGPKDITIVETKGRAILTQIRQPLSSLSTGEIEDKVTTELKLVTFLKEQLEKNKITAKEATVSLSGKDLVIRNFDIPVLPREELTAAINFEAKKYLPFKVEELAADFQLELDKISRRNQVLYVGIKKEILDRYLSAFSKLEIRLVCLEYSAFTLLRLLKLAGLSQNWIIALISVDFEQEDEVNFTVLDHGFPLFSRDISITLPADKNQEGVLEKLKTEIRISLDYYHRKFSAKRVEKIYFMTGEYGRQELTAYAKEINLPLKFVELKQSTAKPLPFNLAFSKGYGASLSKIIKTRLTIDLLKTKAKPAKMAGIQMGLPAWLADLKIKPVAVILAALIPSAAFIFGSYRIKPLQQELNNMVSSQPLILANLAGLDYEQLNKINSQYKAKLDTLNNLIAKRLFVTPILNAIPQVMPEGMWLADFSLRKNENNLNLDLRGSVYLSNSDSEMAAVNAFVSKLKQEPAFSKYFKDISIVSIDQIQQKKVTLTNFVVSCRREPAKR